VRGEDQSDHRLDTVGGGRFHRLGDVRMPMLHPDVGPEPAGFLGLEQRTERLLLAAGDLRERG
jgi:hypothetical protein